MYGSGGQKFKTGFNDGVWGPSRQKLKKIVKTREK